MTVSYYLDAGGRQSSGFHKRLAAAGLDRPEVTDAVLWGHVQTSLGPLWGEAASNHA